MSWKGTFESLCRSFPRFIFLLCASEEKVPTLFHSCSHMFSMVWSRRQTFDTSSTPACSGGFFGIHRLPVLLIVMFGNRLWPHLFKLSVNFKSSKEGQWAWRRGACTSYDHTVPAPSGFHVNGTFQKQTVWQHVCCVCAFTVKVFKCKSCSYVIEMIIQLLCLKRPPNDHGPNYVPELWIKGQMQEFSFKGTLCTECSLV